MFVETSSRASRSTLANAARPPVAKPSRFEPPEVVPAGVCADCRPSTSERFTTSCPDQVISAISGPDVPPVWFAMKSKPKLAA